MDEHAKLKGEIRDLIKDALEEMGLVYRCTFFFCCGQHPQGPSLPFPPFFFALAPPMHAGILQGLLFGGPLFLTALLPLLTMLCLNHATPHFSFFLPARFSLCYLDLLVYRFRLCLLRLLLLLPLRARDCSTKQDREVSAIIKRQCDERFGPTWECIVGEDFKAAFTHETKHFMFVASGKQNVVSRSGGASPFFFLLAALFFFFFRAQFIY